MGVAEGMWKEIHAGRAPSARSLESLVKLDAPVFGQEQRVALEARLDADVLGAGPLREALELPGVSDVLVNGTLIARGEVVVIDEEFGIRISEIIGTRTVDAATRVKRNNGTRGRCELRVGDKVTVHARRAVNGAVTATYVAASGRPHVVPVTPPATSTATTTATARP